MSDTIDIDEKLWEYYLSACRIDETRPSIKDFYVWISDQDLDEDLV